MNSRHAVLETAALPTELHPYLRVGRHDVGSRKALEGALLGATVLEGAPQVAVADDTHHLVGVGGVHDDSTAQSARSHLQYGVAQRGGREHRRALVLTIQVVDTHI